jgi:hypothetical protein
MPPLGLIVCPLVAMLALLGLVACAPPDRRWALALPAVRTMALVSVACVYVAIFWSQP